MVDYATSKKVFAFLQLAATSNSNFTGKTDFDTNTTPTKLEVEDWINESEDYIDNQTGHAWRSTTITREQHHLRYPAYQLRDGCEIFLEHRNITTLTSGTDLIEVWNGTEYVDYVANRTEGRNKDWWQNEQDGVIFIKTFPAYLPRTFGVRITYRYGESSVAKDIQRACILLTAVEFIQSDDRTVLLPEGSSNISFETKANNWTKRAEKIISRRREVKVIKT